MNRYLFVTVINLGCFLSGAALLFAAQPPLIRYQGQAVNSQGVPLEGPYTLTFRLYPADTGGTPTWEEAQINVPLSQGQFSVLLGQTVSLASVDWSRPLWLAMQINAEAELAPRQRIASVPLAIIADRLRDPITVSSLVDDDRRLMPSGAVMFFDADTCPAGWTSLAPAEGRYLVGRPAGGTRGATVGTALSNQENRPAGKHGHDISDPGHSHTYPFSIPGQVSGSPRWHFGVWGANDLNWVPQRDISNEYTGITIRESNGVAGTNAPYLQLLVCRKD